MKIQENSFIISDKYDKIHKKVSKYLCDKTNKSDESLLMNKSFNNRMITELRDMIDTKKYHDNNDGNNKWILSLRREAKEENKNRFSYINVGKESSPLYTMINENNHRDPEFITCPFKNKYLPKIENVSNKKILTDTKNRFNISLEQKFKHNDLKVKIPFKIRLKGRISFKRRCLK